jgi:hypothetical protein
VITIPTVLVLGAGASIEFGFPSGLELCHKVCAPDPSIGLTGPMATLISLGYDEKEVRDFARDLRLSGKLSWMHFWSIGPTI